MAKGQGRELIFLISQPRSGSTLLQHILGCHAEIQTLPEPWLMLPLMFLRRHDGITTQYNQQYAATAIDEFLARLDDGERIFRAQCRSLGLSLYAAALRGTGKSYFLDKTPRYFLIIEALADLYPEARFIFLYRNPVAVLASILSYNFDGNTIQMLHEEDRLVDLVRAPRLMVEGKRSVGSRAASVKYEDLVQRPAGEIARLCGFLDLDFDPQMLEYGGRATFRETTFVDTKSVYRHRSAVSDYVDAWKQSLNSLEKVALARAYLQVLGDEVIEALGEIPADLNQQLEQHEKSVAKGRAPRDLGNIRKLLEQGLGGQSGFGRARSEWQLGASWWSLVKKGLRSVSRQVRGGQ